MNAQGAFGYLVGTLVDLYVAAVMLRLMLQWVRADFYNPVSQFLVRITNPTLVPLRRVIPSVGRLDTASVVLMYALEVAGVWVLTQLNPVPATFGVPELLLFSLVKLLMTFLWTCFFLILAAVILSWVGPGARHPVVPLVHQLTEPMLRPFRRVIPPLGGLDLSPLFALIAIQFLVRLLGW